MNINRILIVITVAALMTAAMMGMPETQEQPGQGTGTTVAVVDLDQVFKQAEQASDMNENNQAKLEQVSEKIRKLQEELKKQQGNLAFIADKNSDAYAKAIEEFEQKAMELQVWTEFQKRKMLRMQSVNIELLYKNVQDSIKAVARTNGIDVVLFNEQGMEFPKGAAPDALMARIAARKVLYAKDTLDITDQVIQDMNNRFKNN